MKHKLHPSASESKRRIIIALFELMKEHPYESIKIKEIADRAQVARQTFYSNFDSKDDVIISYFIFTENQMNQILLKADELDTYKFALTSFKYFQTHRTVLKLIFEHNLTDRMYTAYMIKAKKFLSDETPLHRKMDLPDNPYALDFNVGALVGMLKKWVETGMKDSPEELAAYYSDMYRH